MAILSIIIPTFNSKNTIRAALESVLDQDFQDWECVVVDGMSKDETVEIIKEFCENDNRFCYISESDRGIYDAFNKGWKMAKGEWVHYLGSDDRLVKDGFEKLFNQTLDADLVGGAVYLCRDGEKDKLQFTHGIGGCHQGFITRRTAIMQLGGFDEHYKIFADKDLLIRAEKLGMSIKNFEIPIAYFYVGGVSQRLSSLWEITKERYRSYDRNKYVKWPLLECVVIFIKYVLIYLKHKVIH